MKKTILCVLLALALILSLASCGASGDAVDSGDVAEWLRGLGF